MNFWQKLKLARTKLGGKPIMVLAPMADVTDVAFRQIIAKYGKPDVMWTEFVSADGLILADEKGKKKLMKDLQFSESERPIVAQFFSAKPEMIEKASALALKLGFDGIDINMGCPDKSIEKQGAGAAQIKNPKLAREIIRSAKLGAGGLPVSVKTRIGYNKNELEKWLPELLAEEPAVITIHARTRKEMSKVPARWGHIKEAVEIRNKLGSKTLIFGNGDVKDLADARAKAEETGADGVMLGRAIFGNPWLFYEKIPVLKDKLEVLVEHTKLFDELLGDVKNFSVMKKHFKAYINGFPGATELRTKLMETKNAEEVEKIINVILYKK
ncbi:MAG: tRNA-dihydrouridine synthase [Patescibacteria group bacterium]